MTALIIPLQKLPKTKHYFTYEVPKELESVIRQGQIVQIPFRKKNTFGIVFKLEKTKQYFAYKLLPIEKLIEQDIVFPEHTLKLMEQASSSTMNSMGTVANAALPQIPQKPYSKEIQENIQESIFLDKLNKESINQNISKILTTINQKSPIKPLHLKSVNNNTKYKIIFELIKNSSKDSKQIIILEPTIYHAKALYSALIKEYKDSIRLIHSKVPKTKYFKHLKEISTEKIQIIIGTRLALFAPAKNLSMVIMDNYSSIDYKQTDQNPRYDARTLAIQFNKLSKIKTVLITPLMPISDYGKYEEISESNNNQITELIDMKQELKIQNYSCLSLALKNNIKNTLEQSKKIFLFINQKGYSTAVICEDCGHIMECHACHVTLGSTLQGLICPKCKHPSVMQSSCPKCRSPKIKFYGSRIDQVLTELKTEFPETNILKIDSDLKNQTPPDISKSQIILGTQYALSNFDLDFCEGFGLFGIISVDHLLFIPDFSTHERIMQLLLDIKALAETNNALLLVQTNFFENTVLQDFARDNLNNFITRELQERKSLRYPPYSKLIILTQKNHTKADTEKNTETIYTKIITLKDKNLDILEPTDLKIETKFYKKSLILKVLSQEKLLFLQDNLPKMLDESWIVDVDPVNLQL